jgi:hypothetical protein
MAEFQQRCCIRHLVFPEVQTKEVLH